MLEVQHIAFRWGARPLLEDVTFDVAPGEVVVLTGANGAGKTTLLRILAGLCAPVSGTVKAEGQDVFARPLRYHRHLGYLAETAAVEGDLTVKEYLRFRARLRGEAPKKIRHRVQEALARCGLGDVADQRLETLSNGQRRRAALADALLLRPRFLVLDDLMAGIDPATRATFGTLLRQAASYAAVIVSGHEIDALAPLATRFLVLRRGVVASASSAAAAKTLLGLEGAS